MNFEQKVNYYNNQIHAAKSATEETLNKVRKQNNVEAETLGLTIEEWHKEMQKSGEDNPNIFNQAVETESKPPLYTSADYVFNYLFRPKKKKRLKYS
ncbi:MAG: hypothetical protein QY322_00150 [bacterium]|nr:MAG: hypothetical protein QY322_00150 [bacterium]